MSVGREGQRRAAEGERDVLALLDDLAAAEEALGRVEALAEKWPHTPDHYCCEKCALRAALAPTRTPSGPREAQAEEG